MKITILNKNDAKNYLPEGKTVIFRMGDSFPLPKLKGNYLNKSIYFFSDTDKLSEYFITNEDINKIVGIIKKYSNTIDEFVIHCEYGQGRSPAIGYAISEYLKEQGIISEDINYKEEYPNINIDIFNAITKKLLENKEQIQNKNLTLIQRIKKIFL